MIKAIATFHIWRPGNTIHISQLETQIPSELLLEITLGPPLMLALALHASAALDPAGNLLLFAGESGRGKSTLARYLGQQPGWRRVADDILPVEAQADGLIALPHFPQLKIPADRQPSVGLPQRLPVSALYLLGDAAPDVRVAALSPLEGAFGLIRHTVASRLFDRPLLAQHMEFARTAALRLPVRRLHYPRRLDALPGVQEALLADVQSTHTNRER
ncbi:MAG: hypothetical protein ACLFU8_17905 [Anaerolineales bacterium]